MYNDIMCHDIVSLRIDTIQWPTDRGITCICIYSIFIKACPEHYARAKDRIEPITWHVIKLT